MAALPANAHIPASLKLGEDGPLDCLLTDFLDNPLEAAARVTGSIGVVVVANATTPKDRVSHGTVNPQRLSYHITREREWGCVGIIDIMYLVWQNPGVPQELDAVVAPVIDRDASPEVFAYRRLAPRVAPDVFRDLQNHAILVYSLGI